MALNLMVCCPQLGVVSQPWIERQLERFVDFNPTLVCWKDQRKRGAGTSKYEVLTLSRPYQPKTRIGQWRRRATNCWSGNFLGATGQEKAELAKLVEARRPDVLLCHFGFIALHVLPVARAAGVPLVAHFHGLDLSSLLSSRWYRSSLLGFVDQFSASIVVGKRQAEWLEKNTKAAVNGKRVHLIPCGVPTQEFQPTTRADREGVGFIIVSRLVAWKGVDFSLRAFARVSKRVPNCKLVVVGDGPERSRLKKLTHELGVSKLVHFRGSLPPRMVKSCLQESDVFVQHSLDYETGWYEGFGVSVTEAMAMELPVVASRCGGILDQISDAEHGFLVDQRDARGMALRMEELATDPGLRTVIGRRARQRAVADFDTERQVRKLEGVLQGAAPR